jgi:hypothetical protein
VSEERGGDGSLLGDLVRAAVVFGAAAAANTGRRLAAAVIGYLFVAGLFVASLCFLTFSAHRALADTLGEVFASLIVGCFYLLAGLALALVLQLKRR